MSNTSDQWGKVDNSLNADIKKINAEIDSVKFQISDNNNLINSTIGSALRLDKNDPRRETLNETVRQLRDQNQKLQIRENELSTTASSLGSAASDANSNLQKSNQSPPNTESVPKPANPKPGNNTDVSFDDGDGINPALATTTTVTVSERPPTVFTRIQDANPQPVSDVSFTDEFLVPPPPNRQQVPPIDDDIAQREQPVVVVTPPASSEPIASVIAEGTTETPSRQQVIAVENAIEQDAIIQEQRQTLIDEIGPQQSIGIDSPEQVQERDFERLRQDQAAQNAEQLRLEAENIREEQDVELRQAQREEGEAILAGLPPPVRQTEIEVDTDLTGIAAVPNNRQQILRADIAIEEEEALLKAQAEEGEAILAGINQAQRKAPAEATINWKSKNDWRVRLSLTPEANYLYKAPDPGILAPLKETDGVLFPYLPSISVSYSAQYNSDNLTHNNYTMYSYSSSSVGTVSISCDFTAQDTFEANYLLAVIHFFRSMTKMFYGKDQNPKLGTPPPLCYLFGMGEFQFNAHPLVITSFQYSLPTDVDYIRTNSARFLPGVNQGGLVTKSNSTERLTGVGPGGKPMPAKFNNMQTGENITYVPTHMSLSINAHPIVSRNDISNNFSLRDYATGKLLQGTKNKRGGMW